MQIVVPLNVVIAEQAPQDHVDQAPVDAPTEEPMPVIQAPPRRRRGKAAVPPNVEGVRRSNRLAGLKAGYKDKPPMDLTLVEGGSSTSKNLSVEFEAHVIDTSALPPPYLPTKILRAIGGSHCQMASTTLSEAELNYDSSYDSVESD